MYIIPFFLPTFGSTPDNLPLFQKGLSVTVLQEVQLNSKLINDSIPHKHLLYFFLLSCFFSIVVVYYRTSRKMVADKLSMENEILHSLSTFSKEVLFKYNKRTHDIIFINNKSNLHDYPDNLDTKIKEHLSKSLGEGVVTLTHTAQKEAFIFKLYYVSSNLESDYLVGKIVDVKEEVKLKEELLEKATIDGLTKLVNASQTKDTVDKLISAKSQDQQDALILIDIDNFKGVNDTLGHLEGDRVLQDVAASLVKAFDDATIIGRIGGDEFMLYIEDLHNNKPISEAIDTFGTLLEALNYPLEITASVGLCIVEGPLRYEEAFVKADLSLYDVKNFAFNQVRSVNTH